MKSKLNEDQIAFAKVIQEFSQQTVSSSSAISAAAASFLHNSTNNSTLISSNVNTFNSSGQTGMRPWQNAEPPNDAPPQLTPHSVMPGPQATSPANPFSMNGPGSVIGSSWNPFQEAYQILTSGYHMHSMIVNVLGFGAEVCAMLTHLILLFYCIWQLARRRRRRIPPDMTVGLGLHLSLVGLILAVFTSSMHAYLLMDFEDNQNSNSFSSTGKSSTPIIVQPPSGSSSASSSTSSSSALSYNISPNNPIGGAGQPQSQPEWRLMCIYHLYIRDTLASLYLYLLVVTLITYTKVTFPPRTAYNPRWRAIFALVHSLPWVLAVGASLPICVLNLGRGGRAMVITRSFSLLPPQQLQHQSGETSFIDPQSSQNAYPDPQIWADEAPVRGMCALNIKADIVSASLELFLFSFPILLCIGIGASVCCCYPRHLIVDCNGNPPAANGRISTTGSSHILVGNHDLDESDVPLNGLTLAEYGTGFLGYSRGLVISLVLITVITQIPFIAIRLTVSLLLVLKGSHNIPSLWAAYLTQFHLFLFAAAPMLVLLALIFLRRTYEAVERKLEKNYILPPVASLPRPTSGGPANNNTDGEVLYTNCMLTSV